MASSDSVLSHSTKLVEQGELEKAEIILEVHNCSLSSYLKGKIYMLKAEQIVNSPAYKCNPSYELGREVRLYLNKSMEYFCEVHLRENFTTTQFQDYVKERIGQDIYKVDTMFFYTQQWDDSNACNDADDGIMEPEDLEMHTENMISHLSEWTL